MNARFLALALIILTASLPVTQGEVAELAPNFAFPGPGGKVLSLRSLRGQPVVLLIAPSTDSKDFRAEVKQISRSYRFLATRKTVLIAAVAGEGRAIESNAPFVIATNAASISAAYGVAPGSYGLFVIGSDGNIDLRTSRVISGQRIIDAIDNAYPVQAPQRQS